MARKHTRTRGISNTSNSHPEPRQGAPDPLLSFLPQAPAWNAFRDPVAATAVEDRRTWQADPQAMPKSSRRSVVRLKLPRLTTKGPVRRMSHRPKSIQRSSPDRVIGRAPVDRQQLQFAAPAYVQICIRRKQRREVLFARGKGGGGKRPPRRNQWSNIRC